MHTSWSAANEFCALIQASLDHCLYAIELGLVGNGTEHRIFGLRITNDNRIGGFGCQQFDFRQPVLWNDHSCWGAARLSDVAERRHYSQWDCFGEVGVGKQNVRGFTSQFLRDALHCLGGRLCDQRARAV
ncbi:hypothetical protein D3C81_878060 [compost metagenome]